MAVKAILFLCAQTLLIQSALSQCLTPGAVDVPFAGPYRGVGPDGLVFDGLAYDGYDGFGFPGRWGYDGLVEPWPARAFPCGGMDFTPTAGGLLPVTSASPMPPVGISIVSENAYEGLLTVAGEVPFVGTTAMEGSVPTAGAGAINYGCGNGVTAMVSEVAPGFGPGVPGALAPAAIGIAGVGPNAIGCGRGLAL